MCVYINVSSFSTLKKIFTVRISIEVFSRIENKQELYKSKRSEVLKKFDKGLTKFLKLNLQFFKKLS